MVAPTTKKRLKKNTAAHPRPLSLDGERGERRPAKHVRVGRPAAQITEAGRRLPAFLDFPRLWRIIPLCSLPSQRPPEGV
jgi:hypothetical protein